MLRSTMIFFCQPHLITASSSSSSHNIITGQQVSFFDDHDHHNAPPVQYYERTIKTNTRPTHPQTQRSRSGYAYYAGSPCVRGHTASVFPIILHLGFRGSLVVLFRKAQIPQKFRVHATQRAWIT